ncbi:BTB/POZ domain-containing protein kctd15-like [Lytechinus variegatus]|uniref:BTB/POZ domain-containing protein kctd15-like n=1 Tax=Lytechinus variegatus TaxID=7654 RepID=UPI001BB26176|nr:BTB/POZ domain-containing protein kctd15-like [Lytechinus variegatus]
MGNKHGKLVIVGDDNTKWRLKKSRKIQDPQGIGETREKAVENEKEDESVKEKGEENEKQEEEENNDESEKGINQEDDRNGQDSVDHVDKEEHIQDRTNRTNEEEEEGEPGEDTSEGSDSPQVQPKPEPRSLEEFVGLNVGGVVYTTSRSTLVRYPDSILGVIFTASVPTPKDNQGNYMIDADGQMFRYILNYLRRGTLSLPKGFAEYRLLYEEAAFFQLPDLKQLVSQHMSQIIPSQALPQAQVKVETAPETSKYVIEIYVREDDNVPQSWRIYGSLSLLSKIPTLTDYLHNYRKGSQCLEFTTQHPMFPSNTYRRFPKTTLFYHIFAIGFKLHTSDSLEIDDVDNDRVTWLRYLFTSTTL